MSLASLLGFGRVNGVHPIGFGHVFLSPWGALTDPADRTIPDDGAVAITVSGAFDPAKVYHVFVSRSGGWVPCYSGAFGQGRDCIAISGGGLTFIAPGGLDVGDHDLRISWPGGAITRTDALRVVRRTRRSKDYEMARLFPSPVYAAARGSVDPSFDEVLE